MLFDIDHFKKVNDTYGHQAGDHILAELSNLMGTSLRTEDVFARYGGEEFGIICRGSDQAQGMIVAERIRRGVEAGQFAFEGKRIPVTISVGLACLPDSSIKDASELIRAADSALYASKNSGRNRITLHRPRG